ncbi:MAG: 4-alpha-glucanotransferase, partial [Selenomonadaceae bacterium]|nr:4-alpha-glucanotransferase [Selenomonadaceae bacterium]
MIERGNVEHNSQNVYYRSTLGAAEAGSEVRLGLRIRTQEPIRQVLLRIWQEGVGEKLINLTSKDANDAEERFYSAEVAMPEKGCLMWYYFIIVSASGTCFYGNNPEQLGGLGELYHHVPPSFQITVYNKGAKTPDWFKHSVM